MLHKSTSLRQWLGLLSAALLILGLTATPLWAQQLARLSGTVVDEDGEPLGGVAFRLVAQDEDGMTIEGITTNKKGRFTEPRVNGGVYRVELESGGFRIAKISLDARDPGGGRAGEFEEVVPPGILPNPFQIQQAYRYTLELVWAEQDPAEARGAQSIAAVQGDSVKLRELNALFGSGQMEELVVKGQEVVAEDPDLGGAWYLLGVGQWQTGRSEDGVASFRKALELVPDQPGVKGALGSALLDYADKLLEQGDDAGATTALEEAVTLLDAQCAETPEDLAFLTNRVVALDRLGRYEAMLPALDALLAVNPDELRGYLKMADAHLALGNRDAALHALNSIPNPGHDAAVAMYNIAVEMYNEPAYESMIMVLERALEIEPEAPEYHRLLGRAWLAMGENEKAIVELNEFLRLAPDDPGAEVERRLVEALQKSP